MQYRLCNIGYAITCLLHMRYSFQYIKKCAHTMDTKSMHAMEVKTVSNCSQCGYPVCLMMHEWTSFQDENCEITAEDCIQSLLDGITTKDLDEFFCDDEKENQQPHPSLQPLPPPPKKMRFYDTSEEELVTVSKCQKTHRGTTTGHLTTSKHGELLTTTCTLTLHLLPTF